MIYTTYTQLAEDVKNNLWKVPRNIDGIIAIERSGLIPATMISKYCNIGMTTHYSFVSFDNIDDLFKIKGNCTTNTPNKTNRYLVVDDTVCSGNQIRNRVNELKESHPEFEYITCVVYVDKSIYSSRGSDSVDIFFKERVSDIIMSEWSFCSNVLPKDTLFDFDGVFCFDPPSDTNISEYEEYLKNPKPKFNIITGSSNSLSNVNICSYRIKKYLNDTVNFLLKNGITPGEIIMFNADTIEQRNKTIPYIYKANVYENSKYKLFVESNDYEAKMINGLTKKPVLSIEGNKLYQ